MIDRAALQQLMWEHAGLERSAAGLAAASARLDRWCAPEVHDRRTAEDRNLLDLARLTIAAALERTASVGAHFRTVEGVRGVNFALWAPNALRVGVSGPFNGWDPRAHPLTRLGGGLHGAHVVGDGVQVDFDPAQHSGLLPQSVGRIGVRR